MQLGQPQVPTPQQLPQVSNWGSLGSNFTQLTTYLQNLVRYLQQYLSQIYNAIVPLQYTIAAVAHTQSPYTVSATDEFIAASAGAGGDTTVNLPTATGSGRVITVKKIDANAHNVIVQGTIDGGSSYTLTIQYQSATFIDGTSGSNSYQWFII